MTGPQTTHSPSSGILPPPQALLPAGPEQRRSLLTVLVVMALLATLALLFARGADRLSDQWTAQLSQTSTVQVLITTEERRFAQMSAVQNILISALPPDARMTSLSENEARQLLRPWLGGAELPNDLPVPGVIRIDSDIRLPVESLERQFEEADLRAIVDDHSRFSSQLERTVGRLVLLGVGLLALIGLAATAVSMFATRAGLAAQRDIIHVLVQAGATDGFIARLFVFQAARRGLLGAAIGAVIGSIIWVIVSFGPARDSVGWNGIGDGLLDGIALVILIALFATVCAAAAGWAALRQLAHERRRA